MKEKEKLGSFSLHVCMRNTACFDVRLVVSHSYCRYFCILCVIVVYGIRGLLRWAALFLGELRDGLTMINMQSAFLIVSKNYTEKQAGILFFGTCIVYPDTHTYIYIYIILRGIFP